MTKLSSRCQRRGSLYKDETNPGGSNYGTKLRGLMGGLGLVLHDQTHSWQDTTVWPKQSPCFPSGQLLGFLHRWFYLNLSHKEKSDILWDPSPNRPVPGKKESNSIVTRVRKWASTRCLLLTPNWCYSIVTMGFIWPKTLTRTELGWWWWSVFIVQRGYGTADIAV